MALPHDHSMYSRGLGRSSYNQRDPVLQSPPVEVIFCGFRSDTHTLQQHGWQMALHRDIARCQNVMLFQHEYLDLRGISDEFDLYPSGANYRGHPSNGPIIVRAICPRVEVYRLDTTCMWEFSQIDAQPSMTQEMIDPFEVFKTVPSNAEATFIDKADMSVVEHLQSILEQQKPKQAELREKARKRSRGVKDAVANPISDIVLQVRAA